MRMIVFATAFAMALVTVAGPAAPARGKKPPLPRHRIAVMAWRMAHSMGDPSARHARVYETTHRAAADVLFHGTDPRRDPHRSTGPWVFVVMLRGHFICSCPRPPGAKAPRGRIAYSVWSPYWGTMDGGLANKRPTFLGRFGRPIPVTARAH
jgi:hypothetical protein